jgi:signal transduction histidine kinase
MAQRRQEGFVNTLLVLEYIPFGLRQMLTETIGLYHEQARKKGLTLSVTIAPESPDMVHGDPCDRTKVIRDGSALR